MSSEVVGGMDRDSLGEEFNTMNAAKLQLAERPRVVLISRDCEWGG